MDALLIMDQGQDFLVLCRVCGYIGTRRQPDTAKRLADNHRDTSAHSVAVLGTEFDPDQETCSWCAAEVPWVQLQGHESDDGALLCNDCWADFQQMHREGSV